MDVNSVDDLISRKELAEEIENLRITFVGMRSGKTMVNQIMEEYKKSILRIIDEQPTTNNRSMRYVPDTNVGRWIPVEERPPEPGQRVIATLKHHRWISDYDSDLIPPEERGRHPEYTETKEVLYKTENHWEYEDDEYIMTAYTNPNEDISFPVVQVTAWQPLPEPYKGGQNET